MNSPVALSLPLALLLLALAAGAGLTGWGGWTGTLRRGGALGLRTQAASSSDQAFAVGTKVAAPVYGGAAIAGLVTALIVAFLPLNVVGIIVVALLGLAAVVSLAIAAAGLGEKAARTVPVPAAKPAGGGSCGGCGCGGGGCSGLTRTADTAAGQA